MLRRTKDLLKRALKHPIRVAMNPQLPLNQRHGSVYFNVSGFGELRRDFLVDNLDLLVNHPQALGMAVARQIILLDPTLPKREVLCEPMRIDIVGEERRQVYGLPHFNVILEQPI